MVTWSTALNQHNLTPAWIAVKQKHTTMLRHNLCKSLILSSEIFQELVEKSRLYLGMF